MLATAVQWQPILLAGVITAVLVMVFYLARRIWFYRRLYADVHFSQICQAMDALRNAAMAQTACKPSHVRSDDPRILITRRGLLIYYTIQKTEQGYQHHLSLSLPGRFMPVSAGRTFLACVMTLLNWPLDSTVCFYTTSGHYHADWIMPNGQFTGWSEKPIHLPTGIDAEQMQMTYWINAQAIQLHQVK